ncbi:MAG: metal ABC transporter permease [Pseudomonadota bacterium]
MLDDFFSRALFAGVSVALVTGPLGCIVVWRGLSYFGDTLAHAALLGVALGLLLNINLTLAIIGVAVVMSLSLLALQRRGGLPSDALLGLLSHASLAIGLVVLASMTWVRVDLMGFLFGDILSVSRTDIAFIIVGGGAVLGLLAYIWTPLLAATVNRDLAAAEGLSPDPVNVAFTLMLATVIAISIKIIGVLLITALLIIPAATARFFARTPEQMASLAAVIGVISVVAGLHGSLAFDTPSGPSIVVAGLCLFLVGLIGLTLFNQWRRHAGATILRTQGVNDVDGNTRGQR